MKEGRSSSIVLNILNDVTQPTKYFSSYNTSNNIVIENKDINDYYQGYNFTYPQNKAVINAYDSEDLLFKQANVITIYPGRYKKVSVKLNTKTQFLSYSANISFKDFSPFSQMENSKVIDTGFNQLTSLTVGATCLTQSGSYFKLINIENTTKEEDYSNKDSPFSPSPIVKMVVPLYNKNKQNILFSFEDPTQNVISSSISSIQIAKGGTARIFISSSSMTFDDIPLDFKYDAKNSSTAKIKQASLNIRSNSTSTFFDFSITNSTLADNQIINFSTSNNCYNIPSSTLTLTPIDTLSIVKDFKLAENLVFIPNKETDPINQIKLSLTNSTKNTHLYCALLCNETDFITYNQLIDNYTLIQNSNVSTFYRKINAAGENFEITFRNLIRGRKYKLKAVLINNAYNYTYVDANLTTVKNSSNLTLNYDFTIPAVGNIEYLEFNFVDPQNSTLFDFLITTFQKNKNIITTKMNMRFILIKLELDEHKEPLANFPLVHTELSEDSMEVVISEVLACST